MKLIGILTATVALVIFSAFVLKSMWLWFIVPLGVMPITIPHAMGITSLVSMFKSSQELKDFINKIPEEYRPLVAFLTGFFILLIYWGMGFVIHSAM